MSSTETTIQVESRSMHGNSPTDVFHVDVSHHCLGIVDREGAVQNIHIHIVHTLHTAHIVHTVLYGLTTVQVVEKFCEAYLMICNLRLRARSASEGAQRQQSRLNHEVCMHGNSSLN